MNRFVGFRSVIEAPGAPAVLQITASSSYRVFVNGRYLGCGPARAAHGHFRVDEWTLADYLEPGTNVVAIEAVGYNVNSYYLLDQPAFLQAEIVVDDGVIAATGAEPDPGSASLAATGASFEAFLLDDHVQRVERYSVARTFSEAFKLRRDSYRWRTDLETTLTPAACAEFSGGILLPRRVPYPKFEVLRPERLVAAGSFEVGTAPEELYRDWTLTELGPDLKGYSEEEIDVIPSLEIQSFQTTGSHAIGVASNDHFPLELEEHSWHLFDLGINRTGFIGVEVSCRKAVRMFVTFDEVLTDGDVDPRRPRCMNIISIELEAGSYVIETFEPYTLRFLKLMAVEGNCRVGDVYLREFAHPTAGEATFVSSDDRLNTIFDAGRETFRQNVVDLLMDCPSRERAGWLCDSFFTARAEFALTGSTTVEHAFLENYLLPSHFEHLPAGMLPMNYPADHPNGKFIPNWPLWLVLQLEEYLARSADRGLIHAFEPKVRGLFEYFVPFENEDLLLEHLDGWIFVEWSAANDLVQDVNFPTNMLYAAALDAAGRLYERRDWTNKAGTIRRNIRDLAFDGQYFVDCAVRTGGQLETRRERTEVCQYYAFFFDVVTPESHSELWQTLRDRCGPDVPPTDRPPLLPANMLNGYYLRMELLSRYGSGEQALREMIAYFLPMAEVTGTLWEHDGPVASCNHGFASHVVHSLYRDALGARRVDDNIQLTIPANGLEWCSASMPVGAGLETLKWER